MLGGEQPAGVLCEMGGLWGEEQHLGAAHQSEQLCDHDCRLWEWVGES